MVNKKLMNKNIIGFYLNLRILFVVLTVFMFIGDLIDIKFILIGENMNIYDYLVYIILEGIPFLVQKARYNLINNREKMKFKFR
jgi:hypothetical protein